MLTEHHNVKVDMSKYNANDATNAITLLEISGICKDFGVLCKLGKDYIVISEGAKVLGTGWAIKLTLDQCATIDLSHVVALIVDWEDHALQYHEYHTGQ